MIAVLRSFFSLLFIISGSILFSSGLSKKIEEDTPADQKKDPKYNLFIIGGILMILGGSAIGQWHTKTT